MTQCADEYFDLDTSIYHYCQLKKGHRGKHKATMAYEWDKVEL